MQRERHNQGWFSAPPPEWDRSLKGVGHETHSGSDCEKFSGVIRPGAGGDGVAVGTLYVVRGLPAGPHQGSLNAQDAAAPRRASTPRDAVTETAIYFPAIRGLTQPACITCCEGRKLR